MQGPPEKVPFRRDQYNYGQAKPPEAGSREPGTPSLEVPPRLQPPSQHKRQRGNGTSRHLDIEGLDTNSIFSVSFLKQVKLTLCNEQKFDPT